MRIFIVIGCVILSAVVSGYLGYCHGLTSEMNVDRPTFKSLQLSAGDAFACKSLAYIAASHHPFKPVVVVTREQGSQKYSMKLSGDGKSLQFTSNADLELGTAQTAVPLQIMGLNRRFSLAMSADDSSAEIVLLDKEQRSAAVLFAKPSLGEYLSFSGDILNCN